MSTFFDILLKFSYDFDGIFNEESNVYKVSLKGLFGGHSGFDINKERGNSSIVLA